MEEGRKLKTIRNTIVEMITFFIITIVDIIIRIVIAHYVGVEILGINGLFTSIMAIFSLAEAGFSSIMWYFLYDPIAKNDTERIKTIVNFSKRIYIFVSIIILILSILILPFIQYLITSSIPIQTVRLYFILYSLATICSYLLIYKIVLLGADQKNYIHKLYQLCITLIIGIIQICLLIITKNFSLFLIMKIIGNLVMNFLTSRYINKHYPYLKTKNFNKINKEDRSEIIKKTGAMFCSKIGSAVSRSIDNVLISLFLSITIVGYYSNYIMILTAVSSLIINTINGSCASVGNLWITSNIAEVEKVYKRVHFLQNWIITFCCISIFVLTEDFIYLFFGKTYQLGIIIVALISLIVYFEKIYLCSSVFKDAKGLFWNDRFRPIIEAVLNIILSILFLFTIGLSGILIGTLLSILITGWIQPFILYKHGFNKSSKDIILRIFYDFIIFIIISILTYLICYFIPHTIGGFIIKIVICIIIPNLLLMVANIKSEQLNYYIDTIKNFITKLKNKKKSM